MEEKHRITTVILHTLVEASKQLAQQHRRPFVGEIVWALQQYLQQQEQG
jgi:hypothetical protein